MKNHKSSQIMHTEPLNNIIKEEKCSYFFMGMSKRCLSVPSSIRTLGRKHLALTQSSFKGHLKIWGAQSEQPCLCCSKQWRGSWRRVFHQYWAVSCGLVSLQFRTQTWLIASWPLSPQPLGLLFSSPNDFLLRWGWCATLAKKTTMCRRKLEVRQLHR